MTDADFIAWLKTPRAIRTILVEVADVDVSGTPTTIYLCDKPYVTRASDSPSNTVYQPVLSGGLDLDESLSLNSSASSVGGGDIEISNLDASRDGWLDYIWANRPVTVYMGDPRWPRDEFRVMYVGVVGDIASRNRTSLNLSLLEKLDRLNNPISETLLGGATTNKDRLIPVTFGECHNVEPLLVNPALLEYQVHTGPIEDIIEVRDNGAPVAFTEFLSTGKFRLNQARVGQITCSVQGDKPSAYANTVSALVQRIATAFGPASTRFDSGDLDSANLSAFASANTQYVGLYADSRKNQLEAMQDLAESVGAQVVCTSAGLLRLVKLELPPPGTPTTVTQRDLYDATLEIASRTEVMAAYKLGFCRNWTVQASGLASGLPDANQSLFASEYLTDSDTDSTVADDWLLAVEPAQVDTLLLDETQAQTECARRLDLWKEPRHTVTAEYGAWMLLKELGDAITFGLDDFELNGQTGMVVGISRNLLQGRVTLEVLV